MAAAKQGKGGIPPNPPKDKTPMKMLIRNVIPAEEFLKAYGKYNFAKQAK